MLFRMAGHPVDSNISNIAPFVSQDNTWHISSTEQTHVWGTLACIGGLGSAISEAIIATQQNGR